MGEHSHSTIAEFLNVTPNADKTRLYSARKRLRKYMGELEHSLQKARPSCDAEFERRVISAALPLQLYYLDEGGNKQKAGSTVAARTPDVPPQNVWLIEPHQD